MFLIMTISTNDVQYPSDNDDEEEEEDDDIPAEQFLT